MPTIPIVNSTQATILAVAIIFIILPALAVSLRVAAARRIACRNLDPSDYCAIAAAVFAIGLQSISIASVVHGGLGYGHAAALVADFGPAPLITLLQLVVPLEFLWALSLTCSKVSILLLCSLLFSLPAFVVTARAAIAVIVAWGVATVLAGCFICQPFAMNWDPTTIDGHCGDQVLSFTVTGVINLVTDALVMVLPMPYLYKLQMPLHSKLVLMVVFGLGLVTCIISIIRLISLRAMDFADIPYSMALANIFSGLEPSMAVTLACVPLLRPLLLGRGKYSATGTALARTRPARDDPDDAVAYAGRLDDGYDGDRHGSQYALHRVGTAKLEGVIAGWLSPRRTETRSGKSDGGYETTSSWEGGDKESVKVSEWEGGSDSDRKM